MNFFLTGLIFILVTHFFSATAQNLRESHIYSDRIVFSLAGGLTIGITDYQEKKLGAGAVGIVEYFLPTDNKNIFGLRLHGGGRNIYGTDQRSSVSTKDGNIDIPVTFRTDMYLLGGAITYSYAFRGKILPFLSVGLTHLWFSPKDENGVRLFNNRRKIYQRSVITFDAELGFRLLVEDKLSFNLGFTYNHSSTDYLDDIAASINNDGFITINLGISLAILGKPDSDGDGVPDHLDRCPDTPKGVEVDEFGCPLDSDGDGVPDYLDRCPDTPPGVRVDIYGCPLDSDGDGVPDYLDKCRNTPRRVPVDEHGCPIESDGDGVPDYLDKCPDTPAGTPVNRDGCPEIPQVEDPSSSLKEIVLDGDRTFFADNFEIKPDAYPELNRIVALLKMYPIVKWRIEGHMDSGGSEKTIRTLSERRAEAVYQYFIANGLPPERFRVFGMGDKFPVANNNTEFGRMKNRRVVIIREN